MDIQVKSQGNASFIVSEANGHRSREAVTVTVPANTTLEAGTVLGKITASSKYVRHAAGAADGSQNEAGALYETLVNATASPVDHTVTAVLRDAEVNGGDLTYEVGADAAQITASDAALAALGIIVRR